MTVRQPRLTKEEHARLGMEIYEQRVRPQVEVGNHGRIVAIDVETREFEVADQTLQAAERLLARCPVAQVCGRGRNDHRNSKRVRIPMLRKTVISFFVTVALCGCDMVSSVKEGLAQSNEAAAAIEKQVGTKPEIGFNYHNGVLTTVTVQFGSVPSTGVVELEKITRAAVVEAFKKEPNKIVVSFVFE